MRKILYPEAEEIIERTKDKIIKYMLKEFPTVEDFDKMKKWYKYNIP